MVDQVIEHPVAKDSVLRVVDPSLIAGDELPVLVPLGRSKLRKRLLGFGNLLVETLQKGCGRCGDVGLELVVCWELQLVRSKSSRRPLSGGLGKMSGQQIGRASCRE